MKFKVGNVVFFPDPDAHYGEKDILGRILEVHSDDRFVGGYTHYFISWRYGHYGDGGGRKGERTEHSIFFERGWYVSDNRGVRLASKLEQEIYWLQELRDS